MDVLGSDEAPESRFCESTYWSSALGIHALMFLECPGLHCGTRNQRMTFSSLGVSLPYIEAGSCLRAEKSLFARPVLTPERRACCSRNVDQCCNAV
jgi:hypothetical protein